MKISYKKTDENKDGFYARRHSIVYYLQESILKTHFKTLMKFGRYNSEEKKGFILKEHEKEFHDLVERIEKSSDEQCKKSHAKSIEKRLNKSTHSRLYECPDCMEEIHGKTHVCWESGLTYN